MQISVLDFLCENQHKNVAQLVHANFLSPLFFNRFPKVCNWAEHYDKKKTVSKSNFGVVLLIPCRTV